MMKVLFLSFLVLLVLWIINIVVSLPIRNERGSGDVIFKKTVDNGSNLFYCGLGLIAFTISWYVFAPLKWLLLIWYGSVTAISLFQFAFTVISNVISKPLYGVSLKQSWLVTLSNFIALLGDILLAYLTAHYLFNWI